MVGLDTIHNGFPARIYHYPQGPTRTVYVAVSLIQVPVYTLFAPEQWRTCRPGYATDLEGGFGDKLGTLHRERWFRTFEQAAVDFVQVCDFMDALTLAEYRKLEAQCNRSLL